ncbi:MAG: hypothetical protein ACLQDV_18665 [Candidatus Binataceae bacterium]
MSIVQLKNLFGEDPAPDFVEMLEAWFVEETQEGSDKDLDTNGVPTCVWRIADFLGLIVSDLLYSTLALIICLFALTKRVPEARILKVLFLAGICAMAAYCWKPGERSNVPTVHHERVNMPGDWDQARGCSRRRLSVVF